MSLVHSLKWSFLGEVASKAVTPVVFIVLARLLTPDDFGVMTAAVLVVAFSQVFWDAGMGKALIQRQTDFADAADAAFWVNVALGGMIAALLFFGAEAVATKGFHDYRVTMVLKVMTLQILLGALSSVQTAILQKDMEFKKLFWVRLYAIAIPGVASIPLALAGLGYWALVAGTLTGQAIQALSLWRLSQWRPRWNVHSLVAQEMATFGAWVAGSGILAWLYLWADALIVGKFLGTHQLGLYSTGNQFAISVFGVVFGPIASVLYSHLSRLAGDQPRFARVLEKVIKTISLIAVPAAVILFAFSEHIGIALFGPGWDGVGQVIGILALAHGTAWVVGMNGDAYRAAGTPSYDTLIMGTGLVVYIPAYIGAILIGFETFLWVRFVLAAVATLFHLYILQRIFEIRLLPLLAFPLGAAAGAAVIVSAVKWLATSFVPGLLPQLLIGTLLSTALIVALLYAFERDGLVRELVVLIQGPSR